MTHANIFLAGLLNADGGPAKIVRAFREGEFELVISPEVFDEYLRVIHLFDNAVPANKSEEPAAIDLPLRPLVHRLREDRK